MKIHHSRGTLRITGLSELSVANAQLFRDEAFAALTSDLDAVEIDFSEASLVDSCGLGALISLHKAASRLNNNGGISMRLLSPTAPVQQVFELTRMHHLFEIVPRNGESDNTPPPGNGENNPSPP